MFHTIKRNLFTGGALMIAALVCVGLFVLLILFFDNKNLQFMLSALAVIASYLLKSGVEMHTGAVDRACRFLRERREDTPFKTAADETWRALRADNADRTPRASNTSAPETLGHVALVADVYEEMAILIKHKYADESVLYDYFGNPLLRFFAGYRKEIESFRKVELSAPDGTLIKSDVEYCELEWLYNRWAKKQK